MYDSTWLLLVADGSTKTIAGQFDLAKTSVFRHQQCHINDKVQNARMVRSTGFADLLKAVTKLTRRMEKHLVDGGRSETWFRKSAELRHWISLRSKLAGKLVNSNPIDFSGAASFKSLYLKRRPTSYIRGPVVQRVLQIQP